MVLESESPNLNEVKEIVGDIGRDNRRAGEVIRRLRSYVMKAPFEKKDFDLNNLVAETVSFLAPQARSRQVVLRSKLTQARLRINGDPIQLQQVLSNLILNAVDAASEPTLADRTVTVATRDGEFAEVSVSDTGRGVSEEVAKKIFDPFFSTKEHGMGMGLSIVRTIVITHGGQIDFENRNGANGVVFRVKLPPAMTEAAARITAGSRPTSSPPSASPQTSAGGGESGP
jgi:signal transduction histidine kinase